LRRKHSKKYYIAWITGSIILIVSIIVYLGLWNLYPVNVIFRGLDNNEVLFDSISGGIGGVAPDYLNMMNAVDDICQGKLIEKYSIDLEDDAKLRKAFEEDGIPLSRNDSIVSISNYPSPPEIIDGMSRVQVIIRPALIQDGVWLSEDGTHLVRYLDITKTETYDLPVGILLSRNFFRHGYKISK